MASNTVILKGWGVRKEAKAATVITPGDFITIGATGLSRAAAGAIEKTIAVEAEVTGKDLNTDYAVGDNVYYEAVHSGQEVNALLAFGAGNTAVVGSPLKVAASTGKLAVGALPADVAALVGYAMAAVDNSGGSAPVRIRVEIA
jgi:hypothetical protein